MSAEDERAAANITTGLSGQLIAASLAMLAIEGAVVSFVYGQREPHVTYFSFTILAAIAFILSIFLAGKGITELRDSGSTGLWTTDSGKVFFNWQAISSLIGLCLFFASAFFIGSKQDNEVDKKLVSITENYTVLKKELESLTATNNKILIQVDDLKAEVDKLKTLSSKLVAGCEKNCKKRGR